MCSRRQDSCGHGVLSFEGPLWLHQMQEAGLEGEGVPGRGIRVGKGMLM